LSQPIDHLQTLKEPELIYSARAHEPSRNGSAVYIDDVFRSDAIVMPLKLFP